MAIQEMVRLAPFALFHQHHHLLRCLGVLLLPGDNPPIDDGEIGKEIFECSVIVAAASPAARPCSNGSERVMGVFSAFFRRVMPGGLAIFSTDRNSIV